MSIKAANLDAEFENNSFSIANGNTSNTNYGYFISKTIH